MQLTNFDFLKKKNPLFYQLGSVAEQNFSIDPNTTLMKLRQLGEAIAQEVAARIGLSFYEQPTQVEILNRISREMDVDRRVMDLFHTLRKEGNKATHQFQTKHREAIYGLKVARELSLWYYRSFVDLGIKATAFVSPEDPSRELQDLQTQIQLLKTKLNETHERLEDNQNLTDLLSQEKYQYQALAEQMDGEAKIYQDLAEEQEEAFQNQKKEFEEELCALREKNKLDKTQIKIIKKDVKKASKKVVLNEELTRIIIDLKLNELGWEADTEELTYSKGTRPEKGKNKAISEWPTQGGQRADYVLFSGLSPVGVVEAKKVNIDVAGKIGQAERYSRGFRFDDSMIKPWTHSGEIGAWDDGAFGFFLIPFVYSCNGRPYVKQLAEKSGTWFRDVRKSSNIKRPLEGFHTPEGLMDLLRRDRDKAEEKLRKEGFSYLGLRDYQIHAIEKVEEALENNQKQCLLAMATGTGKTRTTIGLMYRMLKAERFKRILFLVDRNSLGTQALDNFKDTNLEQNHSLSAIYNIAELKDMAVEAETRIQVATVQAMVHRIFLSENPLPIDAYDCIIVDEAHRGYALDQEMTEGELNVRDSAQYLSTYRRVLDYFDATLVGLTATPAKHTTDIFGKPVFTYSYREAVAEDWLIDHEPPIRYYTQLAEKGIHIPKGRVNVIDTATGKVETATLEDEVNFEVESFNRSVITEGFNQVICEQLAQEIDPFGDEKTLIFCATDMHADMVKNLLDKTFKEYYGEEYNQAAVKKITGQSDKVAQLIKQYKNEKYPSIAITVDLLTTGIDVPKICHLVFLRRVKSRILYEQMIGRATRRCDEIGKTVFKIYDPVDIYKSLEQVSTMKPLVKDPNIPLSQLIEELSNPQSYEAIEETREEAIEETRERCHAEDVLDDISQRVMRILRKAEKKAERAPEVKEKLDELKSAWGVEPTELHRHLHDLGPKKALEFIENNTNLIEQLKEVKVLIGSDRYPIISTEEDFLKERTQIFTGYKRPEDFLESFDDFIKKQINESVALSVIVNSPKDLTRAQLKEVKLLLDKNGFSETKVKTAWRSTSNQNIAASIVGYIRQAALGEPLIPFDQRVQKAMEGIYLLSNWNPVQKKWLDRLAKQLSHELVIDESFVNTVFSEVGGYKGVNKRLDNRLEQIMGNLSESLWTPTA